jgi:hypothetical protein
MLYLKCPGEWGATIVNEQFEQEYSLENRNGYLGGRDRNCNLMPAQAS